LLGYGAGAELRQPLGVSVVGGLVVSQALTLFTIPVTCVYMERLSNWLSSPGGRPSRAAPGIGRARRPAALAPDHALVPTGNRPRPAIIRERAAK
jgi:AcrB/AcrD/AcrF family